MENKLTEKHREILHYFWNKSFPDFGHFRIRKSDRKTVPSSSVIKVWQSERIQDTFDTSGRANLERKLAWELFSWRWSSSKILDHGGRGCRSRLTICQLIQFYTNSEAALLSMRRMWRAFGRKLGRRKACMDSAQALKNPDKAREVQMGKICVWEGKRVFWSLVNSFKTIDRLLLIRLSVQNSFLAQSWWLNTKQILNQLCE